MVALALFAFTLAGIAGRRWSVLPLPRPVFALVGAVGMVAFGVLSPDEALAAVDLRTLVLLLGMMLLSSQLAEDGVVDWAEHALLDGSRTGFSALVRVALATAVLSALLVNDAVCLLAAPIVVGWVHRRGLPHVPFLLAMATSSNLGSAATLVGNPQNMLIASMSGLSYAEFLGRAGPAVAVALAAHVGLLALLYRRRLAAPLRPEPLPRTRPRPLAVVVTLGVVAACLLGADLAFAALGGAALLFLVRRSATTDVIARVDWPLLLFFGGLFAVVEGGQHSPHLHAALGWIGEQAAHPERPGELAWYAILVTVGCNLVSNVPFVLALGPGLAEDSAHGWVLLAYVSTVAGNLTLFGSVANLIVAEAARPHVDLGFREYLRVGAVSTALSLAVGLPVLALVARWIG